MSTRPLKVLITDPHLQGGGQVRYVTNLADQLLRNGQQVCIGCKADSVLVEKAQDLGCKCWNRFKLRGGLRPFAWRHDLASAKRFILNQQPDIIHVNGSQDHWVCAVANRMLKRPVCIVRTRHNTYKVGNHPGNYVLNKRWTDYQIVVCDVVRQDLAQQWIFDGERMCAIHNGVDAERFKPDPEARALARAEFGFDDGDLVLGIAARMVPAKGHEFLWRAVAQLKDELPRLRILALGQGDKEQELRDLARELDIIDQVVFAGFRNDMDYCTQAMDIGVQPSIDCDTSSFSLKEQMAAEKPVIASDYGGLTEIVTDWVEGLVVPAGAAEPLAEAIRTLANDPMLCATLGSTGRLRVLRDFTVQVFAEQTFRAYLRALQLHRLAQANKAKKTKKA